jgi:hypothetical protein
LLIQLVCIAVAALIGWNILSKGVTAFNLAQALILFLFSIVFLVWSGLRRKIYVATTIHMKNPTAGQTR